MEVILSYLLGSMTFCALIAKLLGVSLGKNLGGASFFSRTHRLFLAGVCASLDIGKGALAYYLWGFWGAVGALAGHLWSIFNRFEGGRGGSVTLGVFLLADWRIALLIALFTVARVLLVRERERRERFDQWLRLLLLLVLPFTHYRHWALLEVTVFLITLKYWMVGI